MKTSKTKKEILKDMENLEVELVRLQETVLALAQIQMDIHTALGDPDIKWDDDDTLLAKCSVVGGINESNGTK